MSRKTTLPEPESLLPLAPADLQVLLLLSEGPLHPYGISKAVEENPELGVTLGIGSLYRMLNRMKTAGLLDDTDVDDVPSQGAQRRTYRITSFGRDVAGAEAQRLEAVVEAARARAFLPQRRSG